jgi:hypothetical protein
MCQQVFVNFFIHLRSKGKKQSWGDRTTFLKFEKVLESFACELYFFLGGGGEGVWYCLTHTP